MNKKALKEVGIFWSIVALVIAYSLFVVGLGISGHVFMFGAAFFLPFFVLVSKIVYDGSISEQKRKKRK